MHTAVWRPLTEFRDSRRSSAPFPYGYVDNYLPADTLVELEARFLDPVGHQNLNVLGKGKKRVVFRSPPLPDVAAEAGPDWVDAVRTLSSPDFLGLTWECIRSILVAEPLPAGPYRDLLAELLSLNVNDLVVQFEFSSLEAGAYLPPHTDAADKLLSCVLYMPQEDWRPDWGGATEVYVPLGAGTDETARPNWGNRIGAREQVRSVDTIDFVRNRMFWFIKTANSWHGVSPVSAPPGVGRRSFNFSVALQPETLARRRLAHLIRSVLEFEEAPTRSSARSRLRSPRE